MELAREILYFSITLPFLIFAVFLIVTSNALLIRKLISKTGYYQRPRSMICLTMALADALVFFFPFLHASFAGEGDADGTVTVTFLFTFYFLPLLHGICLLSLGLELLLRHTILGIGNNNLRSLVSEFMGIFPWVIAILTYIHTERPSRDFQYEESLHFLHRITTVCIFMPATLAFVVLSVVIVWQCLNKRRRHPIDDDSLDDTHACLDSVDPKTTGTYTRHDISTVVSIFACANAAFVILSLVTAVDNFRSFVERRGEHQILTGLCMFLPALTSLATSLASFLTLRLMLKQSNKTISSEINCFDRQNSTPSEPDEKYNQFSSLEETTQQICGKFLQINGLTQDKHSISRPTISTTLSSQPENSKLNIQISADLCQAHRKHQLDIYRGMDTLYMMIFVYIVMSIPRHIFLLYETMDHKTALFTLIDDSLMLLAMARSFVTPIILLF